MKEYPRLFKGEMVRAIIARTKTQTRRILPVQPPTPEHKLIRVVEAKPKDVGKYYWGLVDENYAITQKSKMFPLPAVGDRIWVRETWAPFYADGTGALSYCEDVNQANAVRYRATIAENAVLAYPSRPTAWSTPLNTTVEHKWKPSLFMPRWASRLSLEITKVRVERLHDITEDDAQREGVEYTAEDMRITAGLRPYSSAFARLWKQIHGNQSWEENPMLVVFDFFVAEKA